MKTYYKKADGKTMPRLKIYCTLVTTALGLSVIAGSALPSAAQVPIPLRQRVLFPTPKPAPPMVDADHDGIPDKLEAMLLATYRPYFRFSRDNGDNETFRPADVGDYLRASEVDGSGKEGGKIWVTHANMAQNPDQINSLNVNGLSSDIVTNPALTPYHINPTNGARRGNSWDEVLASHRIGLYGHVVPIHLAPGQPYDCTHVPTSADDQDPATMKPNPLYYKIEYWQFFGYSSNDKPFDEGDHEADWDTVQLICRPGDLTKDPMSLIKTILFYAHGREMAFDMDSVVSRSLTDDGTVTTFQGTDYNVPVPNLHSDGSEAKARNHVLSLYKDPDTGLFTHPVVFVEHGGHEFWPSAAWGFIGAQKHGGDDVTDSYLAATPPNLGEVEHPLSEDPNAAAILQFNGYWGTYSRELKGFFDNNPPPGPPLHDQWTYPETSSVRWRIPDSDETK